MKYVNYVEFENVNYFVGDFVIFNKPGLPEIAGTIESIGGEYHPNLSVKLDEGGLCILKWNELESIRKANIEDNSIEAKVAVDFSEVGMLKTGFICKGCGCIDVSESFTYCPNCGKEIIWPLSGFPKRR